MILFILSVFCALYLNTSLCIPLGYSENTTTIAFLPLTFLVLSKFHLLESKLFDKRCVNEKLLFIVGLITLIFHYLLKQDYFKDILCFIFIPYTTSIILLYSNKKRIRHLRKIVLSFLSLSAQLQFMKD